ncbi:MAG: hypothetical protein A3J59_04775 [Candidatus Buchananbacteria bacterium RIFCSPHIGHO2_02_FULL_56_16]|uniref:RNA polymerase sigma factor n=1 Tax=Candidatus Buchananbacteria bacterium RIFCSPHIGHO2_02_FULL_56_16 TaxID=1797542 RepID=A0A1G1YCY0_9BACT|nr:MAG: hypothetical protein A3J59_04775 [Candidatus Buchananbacteria bacterium RIFCSPHIGHO2_02_FULL_56_16]
MSVYDPLDNKSDEALVALTLRDQQCFSCLVRRYERKLLSYIMRISSVGRQEAQDILQDVFIKIYTNLNGFDQTLSFSSWAYRITHNQVISHYRKHKASAHDVTLEAEGLLERIIADNGADHELDLQYQKQHVAAILDRLDLKYREVLILKFLEEKNYREISDIIKKPMGTVAALINRAKKKFREEAARQNVTS